MTEFHDNAGHFPDLQSARAYIAGEKGANTSADYHRDRLRALRRLVRKIDRSEPLRIFDFGCGDGMYIKEFFTPDSVSKIVGVDISNSMIDLASENLKNYDFSGKVGSSYALGTLEGPFDLGLAIDVLGYLKPADLDVFYRAASKIIRPGGKLIVMYGNELFDMFALNSGTAAFYKTHFGIDVADLLTEGKSKRYMPADRRNPLSFAAELAPYGFAEIEQAYSQWHRVPPAIGNRAGDLSAARLAMRDHDFDPNELPQAEKWKAAFRSSIFASLAQRV